MIDFSAFVSTHYGVLAVDLTHNLSETCLTHHNYHDFFPPKLTVGPGDGNPPPPRLMVGPGDGDPPPPR
jgi:hypothetical protein